VKKEIRKAAFQALLDFAEVKTVRGLVSRTEKNPQVFDVVLEVYRKQLSWCGLFFLLSQREERPLFFSADHKQWESEGFANLDEEERQFLEFLLEKRHCSIAIAKDGLLCSGEIQAIRPVISTCAA
jgi:hypothetical protein